MPANPDTDFAYRLVMQQPWAITLPALEALVEMVRIKAHAGFPDLRTQFDDEEPAGSPEAKPSGGVGVIPIRGTIKQHAGNSFFDFLFGGVSTDGVSASFSRFLNDPEVRAIVLDIDSPGGSTYGVSELANEIMAARGKKPVLAVANSLAASAAFWLGAAADRFYSTPGGIVGSVGVYFMHEDISKMADDIGLKVTFIQAGENKTRGNEFEELSEEDVAHYQGILNETYATMVNDIARGRGVSPAQVRSGYGAGDVMTASQAKKAGMIDGIKTLADVIAEAGMARPRALRASTSAETETPQLQADDGNPPPQADEEGKKRLGRMRLRSFKARGAAAGAA